MIYLLATNLFAIFIFHTICYSVISAQLRLWTAAQTQILLFLNHPLLLFICVLFFVRHWRTANHQPWSIFICNCSFSSCKLQYFSGLLKQIVHQWHYTQYNSGDCCTASTVNIHLSLFVHTCEFYTSSVKSPTLYYYYTELQWLLICPAFCVYCVLDIFDH